MTKGNAVTGAPASTPQETPPVGISKCRTEREAELNMSPAFSAAALIRQVLSGEGDESFGSLAALLKALVGKVSAVHRGDMRGMEEMLVSQAHALDALFQTLTSNALKDGGLKRQEALLKLALRTQSQCRATIETLSNVKNPRQAVLMTNQANIAEVQQVNNGSPPSSSRETKN